MILALLTVIAAAVLFAAGVTANTGNAHSYGDFGRTVTLKPVV